MDDEDNIKYIEPFFFTRQVVNDRSRRWENIVPETTNATWISGIESEFNRPQKLFVPKIQKHTEVSLFSVQLLEYLNQRQVQGAHFL